MMTRPALLALLIATSPALADTSHDVKCRELEFSKSVETRDPELFRSFLDADARFVGASVSRGEDEIAERWKTFFTEDGPTIIWRPQFVEVLKDGNLALTRGPYKMTVADTAGGVSDYWGTFNSVWRLGDDDIGRVVFDAGDSSNEAPSEEVQALLETDDDCQ
jgi:ketosteroid isomerase-like protein